MRVQESLAQIQPFWRQQVAANLARGADVRLSFKEQLDHFYERLIQVVETGDSAWVDPILEGWAHSRTQTELKLEQASLTPLLDQMFLSLHQAASQALPAEDALAVVGAILPVFIHLYTFTNAVETRLNFENYARELQAAKLALEQLDQSKSDFIAVAAHELRTPLTLIDGYSAMLQENLAATGQGERNAILLQGIANGTQRLQEIIADMIDVSMIDNDLLELNFQPVWLDRIIQRIVDEQSANLASRKQILEVFPFTGFNTLFYADNERLTQALGNLITNAIKFTPDQGRITIAGRSLPGFVELTVADTGIGVALEDQARIFDKFAGIRNASLHSSSKTRFKGGGPGLGLAIAKGIIDAHGGTIWLESEGYDEQACPGTTFHVLLPVRERPPDERIARLFEGLGKEIDAIRENDKASPASPDSNPTQG